MLPSYIFEKILELCICDTSSERLELLNQILFIKWMLNFLMFVMVCLSDTLHFSFVVAFLSDSNLYMFRLIWRNIF